MWSLTCISRTVHRWHSSLVVKRVFFECFDCFMPLFYIAFYQLDVITLRAEIASLFMSESSVGGWMVHGLVCLFVCGCMCGHKCTCSHVCGGSGGVGWCVLLPGTKVMRFVVWQWRLWFHLWRSCSSRGLRRREGGKDAFRTPFLLSMISLMTTLRWSYSLV